MHDLNLWADSMQESGVLSRRLTEAGYKVHFLLSGASEPIAEYGGKFVSGYKRILVTFASGR